MGSLVEPGLSGGCWGENVGWIASDTGAVLSQSRLSECEDWWGGADRGLGCDAGKCGVIRGGEAALATLQTCGTDSQAGYALQI